jgi:hypothetical protein
MECGSLCPECSAKDCIPDCSSISCNCCPSCDSIQSACSTFTKIICCQCKIEVS